MKKNGGVYLAKIGIVNPISPVGVAVSRYERLNMPVIETSIDKAWGFLTYFFHTLIKQRRLCKPLFSEFCCRD
ncbi:MAG: hypothetical protein JGK24_23355 [Microcoleus sp. PH2017_29_MFU_D_A]|uniref:hypothetical protein n=1 Tax=Microcoleus sp. PH2017_29_MFU_D_A TaxID=2798839 RepID=UPI001DC089FB|nr:hypothetical protein [Microcoleus sp. PH2017_29_MFU_D_A]MCC3606083.1 hypothetical protein [Microcoleus sp. PH2017_29_MFU_D_A]